MSLLILAFLSISYSQSVNQSWSVNIASNGQQHFEFWWNKCVGSGHASLALRGDWQKELKYIHEETGMKSVRFHGILNDDVGSYNGAGDYSFVNIFKIWDFLVSINMKPYVEISFTPNALAAGECYMDHYKSNTTPPKDYNEWSNFIKTWMQETVNRYGIDVVAQWHFEVWNEPNISFLRNWNGSCISSTFDEYFKIYTYTANAIKSVSDRIQVGGPATAGIGSWVDQFLSAASSNNISVDFVSSHDYPPNGNSNSVNTNIFLNSLQGINGILDKYSKQFPNLPYYLSEFNSGLFWLSQNNTIKSYDNQDTIYAASFMMFQMNKLQKLFDSTNKHWKLLSYWTFSDIFEEGGFLSHPFWVNYTMTSQIDMYFGMTTIRGINKPVFHPFRWVYKYGTNVSYNAQITSGGNKNDNNNTISVFCLKNPNTSNRYSLFMTNYADFPSPFKNETISISVTQSIDTNLKQPKSATLYRIDENNGNPIQTWTNLGKPEYPTPQQMQMINQSAQLKPISTTWKVINDTTVEFNILLSKYATVFVDIQY